MVGGNLGYAIGPVLAGFLVWWLGLPGLLFLIIPAIVMVFVLKVLLPGGIAAAKKLHTQSRKMQSAACTVKMAIRHPDGRLHPPGMGGLCRYHLPADVPRPTQGYDLVTASLIMTLMLLTGVAGQIAGGRISDRIGRKEFMVFGLARGDPVLLPVLRNIGDRRDNHALLCFGFCLWSTFAVAVAMGHELLPQNVGLASGMMLGLAIGFGGLGVAVNGMIADHYSLAAAIGTIPCPDRRCRRLMALLPYPWKSLQRHLNR